MNIDHRLIENDTELKHVDINHEKEDKKDFTRDRIASLKSKIKFKISSLDIINDRKMITYFIVYTVLSLLCIVKKDFLSLLNPILMFLIMVLFASNPIRIENSRFLDVATTNLISSLGLILKNFSINDIKENYEDITNFFTYALIASFALTGHPGFTALSILAFIGLMFAHMLCFINKDIIIIRESYKRIQKYEFISLTSTCIFVFLQNGSAINTSIFTIILLLRYIEKSIENYEINTVI